MRRLLALSVILLAGCASSNVGSVPRTLDDALLRRSDPMPDLFGTKSKKQNVYWTLFGATSIPNPQIQHTTLPLTSKSKAASIFGDSNNQLNHSSSMAVDKSHQLWVLLADENSFEPGTALVFKLPLKSSSVPIYTFVLSETYDPDHLAFDNTGNLWINSHNNGTAFEYTGPFTKSGTLSPAQIITNGLGGNTSGIALDTSGNLYVSKFDSSGTDSIAVFAAPITESEHPYYLNGLTTPGGLMFDAQGNLYASSNNGTDPAIVRYNSDDLQSGDTPSIVDTTGLYPLAYEANFAFDAAGNLYDADCGGSAHIFAYPTGSQQFSSTLAPSAQYTDFYIQRTDCVWGIAVR